MAPFFCTEKEKPLQSTKAVCQWTSPTMKASSWLQAIFLFRKEMDQLKSHLICCLPFAQFVLKPHRKPDIFENWQNIDKNLASSRIAIHQEHLQEIAGDIFPGDGSDQRVFHRRAGSGIEDEICLVMLGRSDMLGELLTQ